MMRRRGEDLDESVIGPNGEWLGTLEGGIVRGNEPGYKFVWSHHYYYNLWNW